MWIILLKRFLQGKIFHTYANEERAINKNIYARLISFCYLISFKDRKNGGYYLKKKEREEGQTVLNCKVLVLQKLGDIN